MVRMGKGMEKNLIKALAKEYGDAFYILDTERFKENFLNLKAAFSSIYPNFNIAYSYKTNYIPRLCGIINELGGLAEVVSDMEAEIALRMGVKPADIIWNGPYKNPLSVEKLLLKGVTVNIDSEYELALIKGIAMKHSSEKLNLGIRCNFDVNDNVVSRFGIDTDSELFKEALSFVKNTENVYFAGLQCHFAARSIKVWGDKVKGMLNVLREYEICPDRIDLGGGLFGYMPESLKAQFDSDIPGFEEYAKVVATPIAEYFESTEKKPLLLVEPGSALAGDVMDFTCRVHNIKDVRGKKIASVLGSIYNINPTLNKKNPPIEIVHMGENDADHYDDLDFGGFTCIESDYLYKHFEGDLAEGDYAVFGNAGSYSVVLKPPFILPNFPIVEIENDGGFKTIKNAEQFDDLFKTYRF